MCDTIAVGMYLSMVVVTGVVYIVMEITRQLNLGNRTFYEAPEAALIAIGLGVFWPLTIAVFFIQKLSVFAYKRIRKGASQ